MENETEQIFMEQLGKLPSEVVDFLSSSSWDTDLDEIGSLYNLSGEELGNFKREVTLVLAGLVHPDAFGDILEKEVGIHGAVLEAIVATVEQKIFAPVRPALIEFFEEESTEGEGGNEAPQNDQSGQITVIDPTGQNLAAPATPQAPQKEWGRTPDVAPDNLPTAEEPESFLPPLQPKIIPGETETVHPFEEKMKRVFTAGQQSMGDLELDPPIPKTAPISPDAPRPADPYRETI